MTTMTTTMMRSLSVLQTLFFGASLLLSTTTVSVHGLVPLPTGWTVKSPNRAFLQQTLLTVKSKNAGGDGFVDAEFERVHQGNGADDDNVDGPNAASSTATANGTMNNPFALNDMETSYKSLLDYSLDMDPRWKDVKVAFNDVEQDRVMECQLAFSVELDGDNTSKNTGQLYGLGVPHVGPRRVEEGFLLRGGSPGVVRVAEGVLAHGQRDLAVPADRRGAHRC